MPPTKKLQPVSEPHIQIKTEKFSDSIQAKVEEKADEKALLKALEDKLPVEEPRMEETAMVDPVVAKPAHNEPQPPEAIEAPKNYEELNNPLAFTRNQDHINRKITEFRDDIIERFGSSQVPTPAVKDIYKQCGDREFTPNKDQVEAGVVAD